MPKLNAEHRHTINFVLNGKPVTGVVEPRTLLTDFLRKGLGITGVHVGCEHGVCGACTIRINGRLGRACLLLAVQADGQTVETVESLAAEDEELTDIQKAFRKHHGVQCGYCTPGILMSATAFLEENTDPSERDVREMLSGHICRCTGYVGMIRAILDVAATRNAAKSKS